MSNWVDTSDTSCQLKWTWSKLFLHSNTTQACWHNPHHSFNDDLANFHNTEIKLNDRKLMLNGKWPAGCGYCKNLESRGGISDRILHNRIPNMSPTELDKDPTATVIDPTVLEIIFSNTCNLRCIYCGPGLSSVWNNELKQYGDIVIDQKPFRKYTLFDKTVYEQNITKFWSWFEQKSSSLRKLTALGGEPLLDENTYKLLDFFESNPNPELHFLLFTNLMVPRDKLELALSKLSNLLSNGKIKSAQVSTSLECWGPSAEFIRFGLDLGEWEQNLRYVKLFSNIEIMVNGTTTCLSVKTLPELIRKLTDLDVPYHFSGVDRMPFLELNTIPLKLIVKEIDESIALLPDWSRDRLAGLKVLLDPAGNVDKMKNLKHYLDELSKRRNLNWQETFPWLTEVLNNVV